MHPLNPIGENGEESDIEEQMPELLDLSDNEINTSTRKNQQGPLKMIIKMKMDVRFGNRMHQLIIHCFGRIVDLVVLLVYCYSNCVDRSGSLSSGAFNQLRSETLDIVLTILY